MVSAFRLDILLPHRKSQTLLEDIVLVPPLVVPVDLRSAASKDTGEPLAGEQVPLAGVK